MASSSATATAACASPPPDFRCSTPWWRIWRPSLRSSAIRRLCSICSELTTAIPRFRHAAVLHFSELICTKDFTVRRLLCVFPRYAPSFGSFEFSYPLTDGVRAFMPPQGLLVIAAAAPRTWQIRFIDENIDPATNEDFAWAEVVFVSGMHV